MNMTINQLYNNKDFLIMPLKVHKMKYCGLNEDGKDYWRIACGTHASQKTLENMWYPSKEDIIKHNLACCKKCFKNQFN